VGGGTGKRRATSAGDARRRDVPAQRFEALGEHGSGGDAGG